MEADTSSGTLQRSPLCLSFWAKRRTRFSLATFVWSVLHARQRTNGQVPTS